METNQLRKALEQRRNYYISKLIEAGAYSTADHHLYQCTLTDLQKEYKQLSNY
ncbi:MULTISPECIES: Fur-regulated basic protein FbpA [Bacillales]|uniref:Fur-regulated basic protein FbpA n=1 Tax=Bacillales TaxID=1385 RepID=UPI0018833277|nr:MULTISPECIES: Fur-regulated basic protein FbpA [Bacillaceae]MBF0705858.1 Fur-regulated basic protein FbpA [Pseudalkalibacillus hwajinpoensis]MDO6658142.1 Fur-regulated basic protein FbpA [Anaerobacillus sp. 1_MG-2023]WLR61137.1 Fur-regulated basic protein FbpA [Pseudalkalibacillus hwajinpoensis]